MAAVPAAAQNAAVGVGVGTTGLGATVAFKASDMIVIRGAVDGLSLSHNVDYSDVSYSGKAKLMTGGVFADVHPGGSSLMISGGAYVGKRKLNLDARPTTSVDIGGQTFTPAQIGAISGEAKLSNVQPFVGVGMDNTFVGERGWGFRALLGVSFSKKPDVSLTATGGLLANDANFRSRLAIEEANVQEDAKNFRYFPVVQIGLTRRF